MAIDARSLSLLYRRAHDRMRDVDGLHPQEAFDELLKYLSIKEGHEDEHGGWPTAKAGSGDLADARRLFSPRIAEGAPWAARLWRDAELHISDRTFADLHRMFGAIQFTKLPLDVRSAALRTFLTPEIRKGLGIFLTPEDVVRAMVEIIAPTPEEKILDPACGSGTFLLEAARRLGKHAKSTTPVVVYGVDKNPRMLLLADLNLGHHQDVRFERTCADSLRELGCAGSTVLGLRQNSVDVILTNPPFGVTVTRDTGTLDLFDSGTSVEERVPSEVLFVLLCLRLLRPGGRLGIILPRSVLTNERLANRRAQIDRLGRLTDIIDLPTETFAATGTQTTTVAAFFRKHDDAPKKDTTVKVCFVTNVGTDATGRPRRGNQLPTLPSKLSRQMPNADPLIVKYDGIPADGTLQQAPNLLFRRAGRKGCQTLERFVELANTGRTPSRSAYTNSGIFILKVGNLTGRGIDWTPRDRNYVSVAESARRAASRSLSLQRGDLLLTASAHAAKYIAKKADVLEDVPTDLQLPGITFVGELIRVRPSPDVDPYLLLATIRHPQVREDLQASVRGQTAHLNPSDMLDVSVPWDLRRPDDDVLAIASLLRQEAKTAFQLNEISRAIDQQLHQRDPRRYVPA